MNVPSTSHSQQTALTRLLARGVRRQRAILLLSWATWGVVASAVVAIGLVVAHRLLAFAWALEPVLALAIAAGPTGGAFAALLLRRLRPIHAALEIERHDHLQERLSSALLLPEGISREAREALTHDVESHSERVDLRRAVPFRRPAAAIPAIAGLVLTAVTYVAMPGFDLLGAEKERSRNEEQARKVEERKKELEKRLAKLSEIAKKEPISPQTRELLEKLEARKRESSRPKEPSRQKKETLAELSRMRQDIEDRKEALDKQLAALEQLTHKIQDAATPLETEAAKKLEAALERGDLQAASEMMQKLGEQLSKAAGANPEAAAQLGADMDRLMKKLAATGLDEELMKKLASLDATDLAGLGDAAGDLASKLSQLERLMRERDLVDQAAQEIEFTEEELASLPEEWPEAAESVACEECGQKKGPGGT